MRKIAIIAVLVLAGVPGAALAAKPTHPATPANSNANSNANATSTSGANGNANTHANANAKGQSVKVVFVLRGKLGDYTAANGASNGSIAITVTGANHESTLLKDATLTLAVSSTTRIVGTVTKGHDGVVKVRAAKNTAASDLQKLTAFQVIDQASSSDE